METPADTPDQGLRDVVLVADDEPNIRDTTSFILQLEGFSVITAEDGLDCLEMVREQRPRIVLLDLMMPRMNGYDVCRNIRKEPAPVCDVHIIMLTAKGMKKDRTLALEAGASEFMTKPIDDELLVSRLRELLA